MFEKKFSLKHVIKNARNLTQECSQRELHFGVPWGLEMKKSNYLSVFLRCYKKANERNPWSVDVDFEMCLDSDQSVLKKASCQFVRTSEKGWEQFHNWGNVLHNHMKNGCVTVVCHVTIKNMSGCALKRKISFEKHEDNVTDVVLKIGEEKFNVIKSLLAFRSPYFKALFFGNFTESNNPEIELKDVDPSDFQSLLDAIYGESVIQMENVEGVLKLADQFDVAMVREKCEEFLMQTDEFEKKTKLCLADKYELEKLKSDCLNSITSAVALKNYSPTEVAGLKHSTVVALYQKSLTFL